MAPAASLPCVRFAPEVTLVPAPAGVVILAALQALAVHFTEDVLVTCGAEQHPPADPHTLGEAFDVAVTQWSPDDVVARYDFLVATLGPLFTVLYERPEPSVVLVLSAIEYINPAATGPHLHLQRKKGTLYPPPVLSTATH